MENPALIEELFDLTGRVALVTGGTRGLGKTIALTLAAAGADVGLCGRRQDAAEAAAAEIGAATGRKTAGIGADVARKDEVDRLVARVRRDLGPVDVLVACAGINIRKDTATLTEADWDSVMDINVKGSFLVAQAVLPEMCRRKWGRIVLLGSMLSFVSIPGRAAYAASKTALLGLARTLALEGAPHGVCVNAVCPGPFRTEMNRALWADEDKSRAFIERLPVGRWAEPEELRGLVLYLCSPACSFMTGASLVIDGGWTAQ
jgi:NAD(P)-dependent dehydrogenase (short-subunit alcohol dehydrogenase family)